MRYSTFLWGGLALLCATACQKPEPEPEAVPLPTGLKSYVFFRLGSYWVYQDSASLRLDSVWVVSTDTSVVRREDRGQKLPSDKYQIFYMRTRSNNNGTDIIYSAARYCGLPYRGDASNGYPCWSITRGLSLPGSTADVGGADVFPYAIPRDQTPAGYLFGTIQPYWHSQPLAIAGRRCPDVMEVRVRADASEGGEPVHYYWAPHLGIVRQRVWRYGPQGFVPRTRTLLRSRIVQ